MFIDISGSAASYYNFKSQADFDDWKGGAAPTRGSAAGTGTVAVCFGPDFDVKGVHIKAVADAFNSRLISLYLGSSDTGHGTSVTDGAVRHLAARCPALRELALCSCTNVTDEAFRAVVEGLPKLEVLHCTGHDRTPGWWGLGGARCILVAMGTRLVGPLTISSGDARQHGEDGGESLAGASLGCENGIGRDGVGRSTRRLPAHACASLVP